MKKEGKKCEREYREADIKKYKKKVSGAED